MSFKATIAKLDKTRNAITEAGEALAALPDRPIPAAEAIQRAHDLIDAQAASFQASYKATAFVQPRITEGARDFLNLTATDGAQQGNVEAAPLLAWMFGADLKQRLADEINALELSDALPLADREPERKRLQAEIEALEIAEEQGIRVLEQSGEQVERRADASIWIILAPDNELAGEPMEQAA